MNWWWVRGESCEGGRCIMMAHRFLAFVTDWMVCHTEVVDTGGELSI